MTTMLVTIGVCTWNRAALLRQTLGSMSRLATPCGTEWEVLVVNNNSTDDTESVIMEFRGALPIRSVFEPLPGLSNARNRCIDEARGAYVLWTDDDVVVDPRWLREYVRAFMEMPSAAIFGGPIRPWFQGVPPKWLVTAWEQVQSAYAVRELGDSVMRLSRELPYGANYAVRLSEQRKHRYDPRLGRRAGGLIGGEELAVMTAIIREGGEGWWLPKALVRHWIPAARQTVRYLKQYYRAQGRVLALQTSSNDLRARRTALGRPLWLWRHALEREGVYLRDRALRGPERWVGSLIRASTTWGLVQGWPVSA